MQHLEEGTIHAWLDGELSAAEQAQAERHVADCADCAAAVAEARGMIAGASRIVSALDVVRGASAGGVLPQKPANRRAVRWHSLVSPTRAALAARFSCRRCVVDCQRYGDKKFFASTPVSGWLRKARVHPVRSSASPKPTYSGDGFGQGVRSLTKKSAVEQA
jgi:anti-sigma factor RsiW